MSINIKNLINRLFTNGPTISFPQRQRMFFWVGNLFLYCLVNMFYLRLNSGYWIDDQYTHTSHSLIEQLLSPLNIFEYPSYIIVAGIIMALLCAVPILTAQLYNFWYALPFVLAVYFLGHNYVLSLCVLVSSAAAGMEFMRFKSKFIAAILCLLPEILYWVIFSGANPEQHVLRWAVLYAPWILAFLVGVVLIGTVITIGHFVRYRPGVLTPTFGIFLAGTVLLFHFSIGMNERDFQADVFRYSPAQLKALDTESIMIAVEKELAEILRKDPNYNTQFTKDGLLLEWHEAFSDIFLQDPELPAKQYYLNPAEERAAAFVISRTKAIDQIRNFNQRYPNDQRVADALYYQAMLTDCQTDRRALLNENLLRFHYDLPSSQSQPFWNELLSKFDKSSWSIEARWRLAHLLAGTIPQTPTESFQFDQAQKLLLDAQQLCEEHLSQQRKPDDPTRNGKSWLSEIFREPTQALSLEQLSNLQMRIAATLMLIDQENRTGHFAHDKRLAQFVRLDLRQPDYEKNLQQLLQNSPQPDPLIDNIELAQVAQITDPEKKITLLTDLTRRYPDRDGGVQAMLELAQTLLEKRNRSEHQGDRELLLSRCQEYLQKIITLRPNSLPAKFAQERLRRSQQTD